MRNIKRPSRRVNNPKPGDYEVTQIPPSPCASMSLYEVTNGKFGKPGRLGCSYVRCYVWHKDEQAAKDAAYKKLKCRRVDCKVVHLFTSDAKPFCTVASDEGWERDE